MSNNIIKKYSKFPISYNYDTQKIYNVKMSNTISSINLVGNNESNALKQQLRYVMKLGDNITQIDNNCFNNCKNLISCNMNDFVDYIGDNAFKDCDNLQYVSVLDGNSSKSTLKYIGKCAFENCNSLKSVSLKIDGTLWDSELGSSFMVSSFANCENLESVIYEPGSSPFMNDCTFINCHNLKHVQLTSYSTIAARAFMNCTGLENINFPPTWKNGLGEQFFSGCTSLKNVNISTVVDPGHGYTFNVQSKVFENCNNLTSITFPPILTSLNSFSNTSFLYSNFKEVKFLGLSKNTDVINRITQTNAFGLNKACTFIFKDNSPYMFSPNGNIEISPDYQYFYKSTTNNFTIGNGVWYTNFEAAQKYAYDNEYAFLIFYSGGSGCGPCQTAKNTLFNVNTLYNGLCLLQKPVLLIYLDPEVNNVEYTKCTNYFKNEKNIIIANQYPIFYMEYKDQFNNEYNTYKRMNDDIGNGIRLTDGNTMLQLINNMCENWNVRTI